MLDQHVTATGGIITTVIGFVTLFLATSAFVNELRQSMNLVWRVQTPPSQESGLVAAAREMLTNRMYAFLIAVGAGILVVLSMMVNTTIALAGSYFHDSLPLPAVVLHLINFIISFLLMTAVFMLVYKTLPDAYVAWGDAWVGAIATALLFDIGSLVLGTFVAQAGGSPYGTAASVLALLVWVYYSAQVFFFGAELARIFATIWEEGSCPSIVLSIEISGVGRSARHQYSHRPRRPRTTRRATIATVVRRPAVDHRLKPIPIHRIHESVRAARRREAS